ncbi:hypothetical protein H2248_007017 [Termitomyces sp. 'cryptogamus']|nr:hypothetical protein H2248_007017 [Termitomyces sp. 'cryptogamus']
MNDDDDNFNRMLSLLLLHHSRPAAFHLHPTQSHTDNPPTIRYAVHATIAASQKNHAMIDAAAWGSIPCIGITGSFKRFVLTCTDEAIRESACVQTPIPPE